MRKIYKCDSLLIIQKKILISLPVQNKILILNPDFYLKCQYCAVSFDIIVN